jgi:hypothetical protein
MKFLKYFSGLCLFISLFGVLMTLKNLHMSDAQYYGIENDKWKTTLGEFITGVFIWSLIFQFIVYLILTIQNAYMSIRYMYSSNIMILKILSLAFLLGVVWLIVNSILSDNGHHDLLWGPADTGLFFISLSSTVVNYLLFTYSTFGRIASPSQLITYLRSTIRDLFDV